MPVSSTSYMVDAHAQADGRRYVRETHTLTAGASVNVTYLAPVGADYAAIAAERAAAIDEQLASVEFEEILSNGA